MTSLHKAATGAGAGYTGQAPASRRGSRGKAYSHDGSQTSSGVEGAGEERRTTAFVTHSRSSSQQEPQSRRASQVMNLQAAKDMFDLSLGPHYEAMLQMMSMNAPALSHDDAASATSSSRAHGKGVGGDGSASVSATAAEHALRLSDRGVGGPRTLSNQAGLAGNNISPDKSCPSLSLRGSMGSSYGAYDYSVMLGAASRSGQSMRGNPDDI